VENQKENPSKVKTHEEILQLFHDVQLAEEKVRNPETFKRNKTESKDFFPVTEPPSKTPEEVVDQYQTLDPQGEIPYKKIEEQQHSFLRRTEEPGKHAEKKTKWFAFFKKEERGPLDPELPLTVEHPELEKNISSSTFTLQLDEEGNLVGFPHKKPHPGKKTAQGTDELEEEPAKGIKGKLRQFTSKLRRKKSEEPEPGGGIGDKIKGIFKRRSEE